MGDWNTLHFFDDNRFYQKIVSDFFSGGKLLQKYFESELGSYATGRNRKNTVDDFLFFSNSFSKDFKRNDILHEILSRRNVKFEDYDNFKNLNNNDELEFCIFRSKYTSHFGVKYTSHFA